MMEPADRERLQSQAVEQEIAMSIVQVVWGGYSFNASPEQAAKQIVTDLFELLARGGTVPRVSCD